VDLTVGAVPVYFGTMGIEQQVLKRRAEREGPSAADYEPRDTRASLAMGVLSLVVPLATQAIADRIAPQRSKLGKGLVALAAGAALATTIADRKKRRDVSAVTGPTAVVAAGVALTTALQSATRPKRLWSRRKVRDLGSGFAASLAAIALWDFIYYWNHRFMHEARYLWAIHVVHHSSERYNLSTALRQPVADSLGTFVPYGLLCLGGFSPALVERARGVNLLYQYWIHTDTIRQIGPGEAVLNTPSHHRVHHGSNRRYIDRNHGSILILWDRLFDTFQREREDDPVVYGLTRNINTFNPGRIATHEYVDILRDVAQSDNWSDRFSYVVRGPGWAYARHAERGELEAAGVA
jgi:sterol desaturase/sphingolipid hydroxylase (fatty acid hydroxylase superfamily)